MTWLGYGAPLWLAGLAALALPIAIHLLSRGRQRRMPVGSVRWLEAAETLRARRVRPSRWWLLALRCLLLATVALALSGPRLGGPALSAPAPWVLVSPEVASKRADLEPGNETAYRALDAALAAGAELRWLLPGLPAGTFDRVPEPATAGVWSLLREADLLAPAAASFAVFDGGLLAGLAGERPAFGRAVEWWSVVDRRANRWLERASELDDGRLGVVVGNSEGAATRFATWEGPTDEWPAEESGVSLAPGGRGWRLALAAGGGVAADDSLEVAERRSQLGVALFFDAERGADARHVRAALEAAAGASWRSLRVRSEEAAAASSRTVEERLIFWLSAMPVPVALRDGLPAGGVLVSDALERFEACDAQLWLEAAAVPLRVDRCGPTDDGDAGAVPLWRAAAGRPLLVAERRGAGTWLRFASRWHPEWTELVLAAEFPAWVAGLIERSSEPLPTARRFESDRRLARGQSVPGVEVSSDAPPAASDLELVPWLWLLAFALAATERRLAQRGAA